ncbi:hypothetical protein MHU86_21674 [Fragilaria crotonensis]|nr:hypothetical protein MHU86_21674 [Fragilaria crotonensis]
MTDSGGINSIIAKAVVLLHTDSLYGPRISNCWLPAATWAEVLAKSGHIDPALVSIDARKFNTAMSKSVLFGESMTRFDGTNQSGMFRLSYGRQFFYHFAGKKKQVVYPVPLNNAWKEKVLAAAENVHCIPATRARPRASSSATTSTPDTTGGDNVGVHDTDELDSPRKRQRQEDSATNGIALSSSYWPSSPEAYYLFRPRGYERSSSSVASETPQEALERRIQVLRSVHDNEDSWRNVVVGRDADNICTKAEIAGMRQRSTFLCCAYQLALENMNRWTWQDCCREACKRLNSLGMNQATFYKTIAEWNGVFRSLEGFPHPNPYVQCGKRPLPRVLEIFPTAKEQIVAYAVKNLATLTIEAVHDFIVSTVIPRLAGVWKKDGEVATAGIANNTSTAGVEEDVRDADAPVSINEQLISSFLKAHRLESLSFTTAWRWMRLLNFKYDARRKSFYVDGHERDDVVETRKEFCKRYLTELEPYCKRWVQVPKSEATTITDLDITLGHSYFDIINNKEMLEFHIDYWNRCMERTNTTPAPTPLSTINPSTSIRVSSRAKPLIIVGQDESVFAQYLLGSKTWIGPAGQRPLLPKSEGDGYMISAFVSREFGFGRELTDAELVKVNSERRSAGSTYIDTQAALEILGTINKPVLTESPLLKYLYIGVNNEGYWNSFHMSIQFEDVVDCLQVLYPDFDFAFLFDHSQGHARKRNGALSALNMSKGYGGAQGIMRDTMIIQEEGYLGPYSPVLRVGDVQSLIFKDTDSGPWYLAPEQKELQRHDRQTGRSKLVEKSKKELLRCLSDKGVTLSQQRGYTRKELQEFARNNGIELSERKEVIIPGWQGKAKGLLQVLWERGLIESEALDKYTVDGRRNVITGKVDLQNSLRHIMANCRDFKDETALQHLGRQLGVTVLLTPKFHAELAGEGVEYSWAHAKAFYRRLPVSKKRARQLQAACERLHLPYKSVDKAKN